MQVVVAPYDQDSSLDFPLNSSFITIKMISVSSTFAAISHSPPVLFRLLLPVSQRVLKVKLRDSNIDSGDTGMVNVFPALPASAPSPRLPAQMSHAAGCAGRGARTRRTGLPSGHQGE